MSVTAQVECVRTRAGFYVRNDRGLIEVRGGDRVRWLNGMVTNDVAKLAAGRERSGCRALLLTPKGAITADLHVLHRDDAFWLETEREVVAATIARLDRYIVADDVTLHDRSDDFARLGLEGPESARVLSSACGAAVELAPDCCGDVEIAGSDLVVSAYGWSGETGFQLFARPDDAADLRAALAAAGAEEIGEAALDVLRVEAGTPRFGAELDDSVLPDEGRVGHTISEDKGCYTGQEIVARLRSRGHVNHLLVGLAFAESPPEVGAEIHNEKRRTGEVTSVAVSPSRGPIGLGFVRREDAEPGRVLQVGAQSATVVELPFVPSAR